MSTFTLWLNDNSLQTAATTVAGFIAEQQLSGAFVLACNGRFVPQQHYPDQQLQPGDRLELLRPVAGG